MKNCCVLLITLLSVIPLAGCQKTGTLGGTQWAVVEVLTSDENDIADMDISFGTNGMVTTNTVHSDGTYELTRRPYMVHKALIVVTRESEGDLNVLHRIDGDEMVLTAETFQARLQRLGGTDQLSGVTK
jgi:hypothetical protein